MVVWLLLLAASCGVVGCVKSSVLGCGMVSLVFGFSSFFVGLGIGLFVVVVNSVVWFYFTFCVVDVWLL